MSEINKNMPFDKACEDIEPDNIDDYSGENCIEWLRGAKTVTVQLAGHTKLCNRIKKYAEEYPNEVEICGTNKDGSIVAHLPLKYVKLTRPAHREMSDEQRKASAERLAKAREERKNA